MITMEMVKNAQRTGNPQTASEMQIAYNDQQKRKLEASRQSEIEAERDFAQKIETLQGLVKSAQNAVNYAKKKGMASIEAESILKERESRLAELTEGIKPLLKATGIYTCLNLCFAGENFPRLSKEYFGKVSFVTLMKCAAEMLGTDIRNLVERNSNEVKCKYSFDDSYFVTTNC